MKGLIIFYLNFPDSEQMKDPQPTIDLMRRINQDVFDKIQKESNYQVVIVPCQKEACRFEKIDFDKPFPMYSAKTHAMLGAEEDRKRTRHSKNVENVGA